MKKSSGGGMLGLVGVVALVVGLFGFMRFGHDIVRYWRIRNM